MVKGMVRLLLAVLVGCLVGAVMFAGIDWLRTFEAHGTTSSIARQALAPSTEYVGLLAVINSFVDWYSSVFFGYSRFGSGLGTLIGAFWAAGQVKRENVVTRVVVGGLAGFVIGIRTAMFVVSRPDLVVAVAFLGFFLGAGYLYLCGLPSKFAALPRLQFKHGP